MINKIPQGLPTKGEEVGQKVQSEKNSDFAL